MLGYQGGYDSERCIFSFNSGGARGKKKKAKRGWLLSKNELCRTYILITIKNYSSAEMVDPKARSNMSVFAKPISYIIVLTSCRARKFSPLSDSEFAIDLSSLQSGSVSLIKFSLHYTLEN